MVVAIVGNMFVPLFTIFIGVLILLFPGLLRVLIGGYFVLVGVLLLLIQL